jgi:hypothetical protein
MIIAFAAGAAILGIATAIGHSLISERKILCPLYAGNPGGVLKSRRKAGHMAAPTNAAKREESPCQSGAVHT